MKRIINLVFTFIFVLALLMPNLAKIAYAVGPDVVANLVAANYQPTGTFTDSTSATTGSRIQVYLEISNRTTGVDATNLHVSVNLPSSGATTQALQATVSGGNFSPNSTDSTTINITNSTGKLVYVPGSTTLTWTSGSGPTYSNNVMPDDLTTTGFDFAPALQPGTPYSIQLSFLADVVQTTSGGGSTGSQGAQGGTGGGGPAQAPVCGDAKPGKTTLKSIKAENPTSVKLTWTKADNANNYAVRFGTTTKTYQYGVPKTGNTQEFIVGSLNPNTKYYFVVLPTNSCMPGDWSNELSNTPTFETNLTQSSSVLSEASPSALESTPSASPELYVSPTPNSSKKAGVNWQAILIVLGLGILGTGAYTYYKSLPKKPQV